MKNDIPILELVNINKEYSKKVLINCSLICFKGDYVAIIGQSGSGKSTLLNILSLLDKPNSGAVKVDGHELMDDSQIFKFRREKVGFIYQNFNLLENLTVEQNIRVVDNFYDRKLEDEFYDFLIENLGLNDKLNQICSTLSGGEKQRVAVARALIHKPSIIIADEPTGNLDEENTETIFKILKEMNSLFDITIVLVTHDLDRIHDASKKYQLLDGGLHNYD